MKKTYSELLVEIVTFDTEDIIVTSNTTIGFDQAGRPIDKNGNIVEG